MAARGSGALGTFMPYRPGAPLSAGPPPAPRTGGLALSQGDYGNRPFKVPAFSFESIADSFFSFSFFFTSLRNPVISFFLSCPLHSFLFLVPSVPLNSLKLALCLLTPN